MMVCKENVDVAARWNFPRKKNMQKGGWGGAIFRLQIDLAAQKLQTQGSIQVEILKKAQPQYGGLNLNLNLKAQWSSMCDLRAQKNNETPAPLG